MEPLDVDNYNVWKIRMTAYLIHKNLYSPITTVPPTDAAELVTWKETDRKAKSLIIMNVRDHHLATVEKCTTAKDAWTVLSDMHQSKVNARKLQLRREMNNLRKEGGEPLTKYFNRAMTKWTELTSTGHDMKETDAVWSALAGLPKQYSTAIAIMESSSEELKFSSALSRLLLIEQRLENHDDEGGTSRAFFHSTQRGWQDREEDASGHDRPQYRGSEPPWRATQGDRRSRSETHPAVTARQLECFYCHKKGHIKRDCHKYKADQQAKGEQPIALAAGTREVLMETSEWSVDSGATQHMTPSAAIMSNLRAHEITVTTGKGQLKSTHTGDIILIPEGRKPLMLTNVLLVPGLWTNLFSVSAATGKGAKAMMNCTEAIIRRNDQELLQAFCKGGLYTFRATYPDKAKPVARATALVTKVKEVSPIRDDYSDYEGVKFQAQEPRADLSTKEERTIPPAQVEGAREPEGQSPEREVRKAEVRKAKVQKEILCKAPAQTETADFSNEKYKEHAIASKHIKDKSYVQKTITYCEMVKAGKGFTGSTGDTDSEGVGFTATDTSRVTNSFAQEGVPQDGAVPEEVEFETT